MFSGDAGQRAGGQTYHWRILPQAFMHVEARNKLEIYLNN